MRLVGYILCSKHMLEHLNPINIGDMYYYKNKQFVMNKEDFIFADLEVTNNFYKTQHNPPDNLDILDNSLMLDKMFNYYDTSGFNVTNYIFDSGVEVNHPEFEGRASIGLDLYPNTSISSHGTSVASIIGSKTYGVAKKTKIVSIRILDELGAGTIFTILKGIEWVMQHKEGLTVINLSLNTVKNDALNDLLDSISSDEVFIITSSGNQHDDACKYSPSSAKKIITVGGITDDYTRLSFANSYSNYGKCVDILAPSKNIMTIVGPVTGTSFASPHVAGVISLLLSKAGKFNLKDIIVKDIVWNVPNDTENSFCYSKFI